MCRPSVRALHFYASPGGAGAGFFTSASSASNPATSAPKLPTPSPAPSVSASQLAHGDTRMSDVGLQVSGVSNPQMHAAPRAPTIPCICASTPSSPPPAPCRPTFFGHRRSLVVFDLLHLGMDTRISDVTARSGRDRPGDVETYFGFFILMRRLHRRLCGLSLSLLLTSTSRRHPDDGARGDYHDFATHVHTVHDLPRGRLCAHCDVRRRPLVDRDMDRCAPSPATSTAAPVGQSPSPASTFRTARVDHPLVLVLLHVRARYPISDLTTPQLAQSSATSWPTSIDVCLACPHSSRSSALFPILLPLPGRVLGLGEAPGEYYDFAAHTARPPSPPPCARRIASCAASERGGRRAMYG
ncbi:hypothetical protein C8R46DRAFT_1278008 [Mycena filopes]|nr:hypothetical protein C8R46DRAFT_1278008 [Mycena filopes]